MSIRLEYYENFPRVNDIRNLVVAEGMKVLGFVNRFSRGVLQVQDQLEENGNGLPEFDLILITAFLVTERISPVGSELERKAIEQGFLVVKEPEVAYQKSSFQTTLIKNVYETISMNPKIKHSQLEGNFIGWLKEYDYINTELPR